jgi:hypothetical protein
MSEGRSRKPVWCGVALAAVLTGCAELRTIVPPPKPAAEKAAPAGPVLSPPVLSPEVSPEEAERLSRETMARIDATEELVRPVDGKNLPPDQAETYSTIQNFLAKAREALGRRDLQRALTLADKAHILAEELVKAHR